MKLYTTLSMSGETVFFGATFPDIYLVSRYVTANLNRLLHTTRSESQEESGIIKLYFDLLLTVKCLCGLSSSKWLFGTGLTSFYSFGNPQTYVFLLLTAVNCGTLTYPTRGRVSHTGGTTYGKTATYSCYTGYRLVGSSSRTCQATRVWSGSAPTCHGNYFIIMLHIL